jgi:hypothetical protein
MSGTLLGSIGTGTKQDRQLFGIHGVPPLVIECLNVFGSSSEGPSPHLKMCYAGYGHPFRMFLEHQVCYAGYGHPFRMFLEHQVK